MARDRIEILFSGHWSAKQVSISEIPTSREIDQDLETKATHSWEQMLIEAKKTNKLLWDSILYRFENAVTTGENISLIISSIPFSIRFGMNKHTAVVQSLGANFASRGIFSSCLVETADGLYVFIEKSDKYYTQKKYSWVGGVLSKTEEEIVDGISLFESVSKEVSEELGVSRNLHQSTLLRTGYLTENGNVCFLFSITLKCTSKELREHFKSSDNEASGLLVFSEINIKENISIFESKDQIKFALLDLI